VLFAVRARLQTQDTPETAPLRFNPQDCHPDIKLKYDLLCAVKVKQGLYRSVRSAAAIPVGKTVYFEMSWAREGKGGGICVGLSTTEMHLDKLVGMY